VAEPFCEACTAWKKKTTHGPYRLDPAAAYEAFRAGDPLGMVVPADGDAKVTVAVYECPGCGTHGPLDVQLTGSGKSDGRSHTVDVFLVYPGEARDDFDRAARKCDKKRLKVKED
jgi:hypothetical protein